MPGWILILIMVMTGCSTNTDPLSLQVSSRTLQGDWQVIQVAGGIAGADSIQVGFNRIIFRGDSLLEFYQNDSLVRREGFTIVRIRSIFTHKQVEALVSDSNQFEPLLIESLTPAEIKLQENCTDCYSYILKKVRP